MPAFNENGGGIKRLKAGPRHQHAIRDAKAKIIAAKGEKDASIVLTEAVTVISESSGAMQL